MIQFYLQTKQSIFLKVKFIENIFFYITGSVNTLKRPSPEPLNESPSKGGKNNSTAAKKPKPPRKKKKKDPNEPTKPVSAYALFFRDTQAAIKGQNPNASFGEVSTIVASMWDALAHEHKEVYKKKTEAAKKEYLKTLAVYRASIVSKGNDVDTGKPTTPTGTVSPQNQIQQANSAQQSPQSLPNQQQASTQPTQAKQESPIQTQLSSQPNANINQQTYIAQPQAGQQAPMPQSSPYQQTYNPSSNVYKSPPNPNQIDYNNMNMPMTHNQMSPIHQNVPQNHQMQMQHMGHPQQQQQQVPMVRYGYEQQPPPPHNIPMDPYNSSPNHANLQPPMQQIPTHHQPHGISPNHQPYGNSEGVYNIHDVSNQNFNSFQLNQQPTPTMVLHNIPPNQSQETAPQLCIRVGCQNPAIAHRDWEDEYCSNSCVVLHCRNVFSNWVQSNNSSINPQQNYSVK